MPFASGYGIILNNPIAMTKEHKEIKSSVTESVRAAELLQKEEKTGPQIARKLLSSGVDTTTAVEALRELGYMTKEDATNPNKISVSIEPEISTSYPFTPLHGRTEIIDLDQKP